MIDDDDDDVSSLTRAEGSGYEELVLLEMLLEQDCEEGSAIQGES